MAESLKSKTARGLLWGGLNKGFEQLLNLAFGIILLTQLTPAEYGMVGMFTVFSSLAGALQDGGFISALNKRQNVCHEDYNSVFWFNISVGGSLYVLLFFCAPYIAGFFHEPELTPLARYVFLGFLITAFNISARAVLFRKLMVRESAITNLVALSVSGVLGIVLVFLGFSYWALATQSLIYVFIITILSFHFSKFRPSLHFTMRPIREMFGFSSSIIVTNIVNILNQQVLTLLFARFYTKVEVGNFSQANKWNFMGHQFVTSMLGSVAQPVFTKVDDDRSRQLAVFRKLMRFTAMFAFPMMFGLSIITREFFTVTIGERWLQSASILSLLCLWGAFVPLNSLMSNLLVSRGRSDIYMWCTIGLCLAVIGVAVGAHSFGMQGMLYGFVAVNIAWFLVWHHFVKREIGLRLTETLRDIAPYLLLSLALAVATHAAASLVEIVWLRLMLKVVVMAVAYCAVLWLSGSVIFREGVDFVLKRKVKE